MIYVTTKRNKLVGVPVMCTPESAARLATCRAEVQTDIQWALIDRSKL